MEHLLSRELVVRAQHLIWIEVSFLAIINITAISGNISVCYAVYGNQRLRSLANMFVVALAASDILISVYCMPLSVAALIQGRWIFGTSVCRLQGFAMFTFSLASLNTMGVIAVSRYFCVVKPTRYIVLFRRQRIVMYTSVVWCMALIGSVPPLIFQTGGYTFQPGKAMCMYPFQTNMLIPSSSNVCLSLRPLHSSLSATPKCFTKCQDQIVFSRKKITLNSSEQTSKKPKWPRH